MDAIYFRPLPYPGQDRLALLSVSEQGRARLVELDDFTFRAVRQRVRAFDAVAAYRSTAFNVNAGHQPTRFAGQWVTRDFFRTLGMQPALGRTFTAEEEAQAAATPPLVISHRVWQEYFSARADIVGLAVRVDGKPATIVGVMPPGFGSFMEGRTAQVWALMRGGESPGPDGASVGHAIARLAPGASLAQASEEVAAARGALAREFPDAYRDRRPVLRDFRASLFGGFGPAIRLLSVVVALLLVIACGNAANLLLGRAVQRSREMALRTALGASRSRLARGLLAESLGLAVAANLLALVLAYWGVRLLWARTSPIFRVIGVEAIAFDHRVFVFSLLVTLVTTVLFGILPALRGTRADLSTVLRRGAQPAGRRRRGLMSRTLVVSQVALCVFTMIGTLLVFRSFLHVSRVTATPGFEAKGLLVAGLPQPQEGRGPGAAVRAGVVEEIARRVAAIPGGGRVAIADRVPFVDADVATRLSMGPAGTTGQPGRQLDADVRRVGGAFFDILSIPLRRGRLFADTDTAASAPVIVISDRLADAGWKGRDPLGDRLLIEGAWRTIVGVVSTTVKPSPLRPSMPAAYVPWWQSEASHAQLLVRSNQAVPGLAAAVRRQVRAVDADQPVDLRTMEEMLDAQMTPFRLVLVLMAVFGAIALSLSALGLYGVMAHDVSRRTQEMGVRMAVGARSGEVVRLVVRDGLRLAGIGLVVGLLPGLAVAKILPSELFGARGLSPAHYAGVAALWLAIAVLTCLVPARRAAGVDPLSALRCE